MAKTCEVCGLKKSSDTEQSFHKFPTNKATAVAWCKALHLDINNLVKNSVICSDHFLPDHVFRSGCRTVITKAALPVLTAHDESTTTGDPTERFPVSEGKCKLWLSKINKTDDDFKEGNTRFICSKHFKKEDFRQQPGLTRLLLNDNAVPFISTIAKQDIQTKELNLIKAQNTNKTQLIDEEQNYKSVTQEELRQKCRTCLKDNGVVNVFSTQHKEVLFSDIFDMFSLSLMKTSDGLPHVICATCAKLAMDIYSFKEQIEQSTNILESVFGLPSNSASTSNVMKPNASVMTNDNNVEISGSRCKLNTKSKDHRNRNSSIIDKTNMSLKLKKQIRENFSKKFNHIEIEVDGKIVNDNKEIQFDYDCTSENADITNGEGDIFLYYDDLRTFVKDEKEIKEDAANFSCTSCDLSFSTETKYLDHRSLHESAHTEIIIEDSQNSENSKKKVIPFKRSVCNLEFATSTPYRIHKKNENKKRKIEVRRKQRAKRKLPMVQKKYPCPLCGKVCGSYILKDHINTHYNLQPYMCDICGLKFSYRANFHNHKSSHICSLLCHECGKTFSTQVALKFHVDTQHLGKRPHVCTFCSKTYGKPQELKAHLRHHTGERPYMRKVCGTGFAQSNHLKKHSNCAHGAEKRFWCNKCYRGFANNEVFKEHVKRHEKIYQSKNAKRCKICNKLYRNISAHLHIHTKEKLYRCEICTQGFSTSHMLNYHYMYAHKDEKNSGKSMDV